MKIKNQVKNKEIYLSTGAVIEFIQKKIKEKKYKQKNAFNRFRE